MRFIDDNSLKSINGKDTLNQLKLHSSPGKQLLNNYLPLTKKDYDECKNRYESVGRLISVLKASKSFYDRLSILLSHIDSLINTFDLIKNNDVLENTQLFEIKQFIFFTRQIYKLLVEANLEIVFKIDPLDSLWELLDIENKDSPSFYVSNLYSEKLQEERHNLEILKKEIDIERNNIASTIKKQLGFLEAKETIIISRMNTSIIESIEKSNLYTKTKQTFANVTYEVLKTPKFLDLERKKELLIDKIKDEEYKVRVELSNKIRDYINILINNTNTIAKLDLKLAKAKYSIDNKCVIPKIITDKSVRIKNGRNIFIEEECSKTNLKYNPINIDFTNNVILITGSNMAGKSTLIKTIGNMFFHLSYAIPIPAQEIELPLVDFIYFSVDTNREEQSGLSCFGAEIYELNNFININNEFGLYLIDEFARGTNPYEGEAFCYSLLKYLQNKDSITICVTHFSKPTTIDNLEHFQVIGLSQIDKEKLKKEIGNSKNLNERLKLLNKYMNYNVTKITKKTDIPYEALTVAELLGINKQIIDTVKKSLNEKNDAF